MSIRTWLAVGALALLVVAAGVWLAVRAAQGPPQPGDTVDLPQSSSAGVPSGNADEMIVGGLSSSRDNRCVMIQPLGDEQSYEAPPQVSAVWPKGYEGRIAADGDFRVLDASGHVLVREGEIMAFTGRWVGASKESCLAGRRVFEVTATPQRYYFAE